jgi:hypothetical protein
MSPSFSQIAHAVCLEVLIDHAKPEIDVWVDGTEVPDLHHTDWPLDSYDSVRVGFEKCAGPGIDIWYDDIAVGTERMGCNYRGARRPSFAGPELIAGGVGNPPRVPI